MTSNDKKWGPFTFGPWKGNFSVQLSSGDDEDPGNEFRVIAFGWAIKCSLPQIIKPAGKYGEYDKRYGFTLSDMGAGYNFFQIFYGADSYDSRDRKHWACYLPWKMWNFKRHSLYDGDGNHVITTNNFDDFNAAEEDCKKAHFKIKDYDGEEVVATCYIEEREWSRGEGWFKWLKFFYKNKVRRSLRISFNEETGPEKGSWKGGTLGTGIDISDNENVEEAFRRYCSETHSAKGREYKVEFVEVCGPPPVKPVPEIVEEECGACAVNSQK